MADDTRFPAIVPDLAVQIGQQEVDEGSIAVGMHLVTGQFQAHMYRPGMQPLLKWGHQFPAAPCHVLLQGELVRARYLNVYILVDSRYPAKEQVERPAATDVPRVGVFTQFFGHTLERRKTLALDP